MYKSKWCLNFIDCFSDEVSTPKKQKEEEEQNIKTDYEQWKKQILENARIAIKDGKWF